MNRFGKIGTWILIAAAVILPMYELADYTEVWSQDQNFVLPAIMLLFIGMALAGANLALDLVLSVAAVVSHIFAEFSPRLSSPSFISLHDAGPPQADLPVIFCDLRL